MLFSEPKIPQYRRVLSVGHRVSRFSALQRAENSSIQPGRCEFDQRRGFSALQRAENSSIQQRQPQRATGIEVSVLFSEPKIPQSITSRRSTRARRSVSVLFSEPKIPQSPRAMRCSRLRGGFQCSSASRKFLNSASLGSSALSVTCFSALQRAENSSIARPLFHAYGRPSVSVLFSEPKIPQSLNTIFGSDAIRGFSALQRAENSSIHCARLCGRRRNTFQCSSASRKFLNTLIYYHTPRRLSSVSVLFSEPKIPQLFQTETPSVGMRTRFQCSSASRKFLNIDRSRADLPQRAEFQCSSASRKFLNYGLRGVATRTRNCFSALQRAENSSILGWR